MLSVYRYLTQTFSLAHAYANPDVVVFLGDLMDEGSKATKDEYMSYYFRFLKVFSAADKDKVGVSCEYICLCIEMWGYIVL